MKQIFAFLLAFLSLSLFAQDPSIKNPTSNWSFKQVSHNGNKYVVSIHADIEKGWKVFSATMKDDEPNLRVSFDSSSAGRVKIVKVSEEKTLKGKEPAMDNQEIGYVENAIDLEVEISVSNGSKPLSGSVSFMAISGQYVFGPEEQLFRFEISGSGELSSIKAGLSESSAEAEKLKRASINLKEPAANCGGTGAENAKTGGLVSLFFIGFAGGLIALFTPCVFPMIPLTVSFFTKRAQSRKKGIINAGIYSGSIFLIYVLLSLPFHFLDTLNPEILNNISTNVWLNLIFFVVFIAFALSFFGLYSTLR